MCIRDRKVRLGRPMVTVIRTRFDGPRILVGILAFAAVTAIAAASGGYFPTSWSWATLGFAWTAALALAFRDREAWGRRELLLLVALLALAGWAALSTLWSLDATQSVLEAQRVLVYLAAGLALVALVRRGEHPAVLGGVLAGIVAISTYALATRLFPDRLGYYDPTAGYRLSMPLGYWNALGIFAVIGILLALSPRRYALSSTSTAKRSSTPG